MANLLTSLFAFMLLQAATAPQAPPPQSGPIPTSPIYVVGANDVLGIKVFEEPGLSGNFSIDSDGSITYPFLGRVEVGGMTVKEIEALLTKKLLEGYVRRPVVSVEIAQYRSRSIYVLGEVRAPGKYNIEGTITLLEVIARAGSLTNTAGNTIILQRYKDGIAAAASKPALAGDPQVAEVMRVSYEDLKEGRISSNIIIQDSDTIFVPQAERFYVTGFVKTPGTFVLQPGMTVSQAIAVAGGLTERGSSRGLKILRKDKNGKEIEVDAKMSDFVKPNDTIKVRQRLI